MTSSQEKFIKCATTAIEDGSEAMQNAQQMLHGHIHVYGEGGIDRASQRMESCSKQQWLRWGFYLLVTVISVIILTQQIRSLNLSEATSGSVMGLLDSVVPSVQSVVKDEQALLVLKGRYSSQKPDNPMFALWQSDPDNRAYFYAYTLGELDYMNDRLPEDFLEIAERIDPGNGWYPFMKASHISEKVVSKNYSRSSRSSSRRTRGRRGAATPSAPPVSGPVKKYIIDDPIKYREALALFYQAAEAETFHCYAEELAIERAKLLPEGGDMISRLVPITYTYSQGGFSYQLLRLNKVIGAESERCAEDKDVDGLRKLIRAWKHLGKMQVEDSIGLVDILVAQSWFSSGAKDLAEAAKVCGLDQEEEELQRIHDVLDDARNRRRSRTSPNNEIMHMKAGVLHEMTLPILGNQLDSPRVVTEEELMPGRQSDHAFLNRVFHVLLWLLFLAAAGDAWVMRFRLPRFVRSVSSELAKIFTLKDYVIVCVLGVLLPMLYYWIIQHLTPLSTREFSLGLTVLGMPSLQLAATMVLVMCALVVGVRLRLKYLLHATGCRATVLHWVSLVCAALAVPAAGFPPYLADSSGEIFGFEHMKLAMIGVSALLAVPVLIFLWMSSQIIFLGGEDILRRGIVHRVLVPCCVFAALVSILMVPVYQAEERKWVAADELLKFGPETPGTTAFEYEVFLSLKEQVINMLGIK